MVQHSAILNKNTDLIRNREIKFVYLYGLCYKMFWVKLQIRYYNITNIKDNKNGR